MCELPCETSMDGKHLDVRSAAGFPRCECNMLVLHVDMWMLCAFDLSLGSFGPDVINGSAATDRSSQACKALLSPQVPRSIL